MLKKILKIAVPAVIGVLIGIYIYAFYGAQKPQSQSGNDSLFSKSAYAAMQTDTSLNEQIGQSRQTAITKAVNRISPVVVSVNVKQVREYTRRSPFRSRDPFLREFFPELFKDQRFQEEFPTLGSGFVISDDGYILTNDHVVEKATSITITIPGGKKFNAEIVGTDPMSDVALLKIDQNNLPFVTFGNSNDILLGEWAIAVGNPFGLFERGNRATVTVGVISAVDRDFGELAGRIYQDMIQTDASINTGNSGGPLCNALGEVIGMNTFIYTSGQYEGSIGIGFAIPINRITRLIDDLKKYNKIDRDFWIGIRVQNVSSVIARKMGYNKTEGVLVVHIDRNSPADKSGLHLGDIITEIEGKKISSDKIVFEAIYGSDLRVGDSMKLKIWRDGEVKNIKMKRKKVSPGKR